MRRMNTFRRRLGLVLACWIVVSLPPALFGNPSLATLQEHDLSQEETIHISIAARSFQPSSAPLHVGKTTRLVFHNQDAELHAVVPVGLLAGLHLNIRGNGAPEFDEQGFKRVIIPSQGTAELRFIPVRTGIFPYYCDMPGHQMSATFVVE